MGVDVREEYGVGILVRVFGSLSRKLNGGVLVQTRLDTTSDDIRSFDWRSSLQIDRSATKVSTNVNLDLQTGGARINTIKVEQPVTYGSNEGYLQGRWDARTLSSELQVAYRRKQTTVRICADDRFQKVTVAQQFGPNEVAPTIRSDGSYRIQYRTLFKNNRIVSSYEPWNAFQLQCKRAQWTVDLKLPLRNHLSVQRGTTLSFKRSLDSNDS